MRFDDGSPSSWGEMLIAYYDYQHIYQQQIYILAQGAGVEEVDAETFVENLPGGFSLSSSTLSLVRPPFSPS